MAKLTTEVRRVAAAWWLHRSSPWGMVRRYLHLYRNRQFSPDEIQFLDLLNPNLSEHDLAQVVAKEELLAVQRRLNASAPAMWTEDKLEFHRRCKAAGLPVPRLYAVYAPPAAGQFTAPDGVRWLADEADLAAFLGDGDSDAEDLIVKPVDGVHGEGILRLRRDGRTWSTRTSERIDPPTLLSRFAAGGYDQWMFQQRIAGHPDLCALSGADGLQTIRMVTVVRPDNRVEVLAARLRLIGNDLDNDNFDLGRSGNIVANLDPATGRIRSAVGCDDRRLSMRQVENHPRTGRPLIGYAVPQWQGARELAHAAAAAFTPLRTIGWDVAITPTHPCLIEGNVTWDTLIGEPRMGQIFRDLTAMAGP